MAVAVLIYRVQPSIRCLDLLVGTVAAVPLNSGELDLIGAIVVSDTTTADASGVVLRIVGLAQTAQGMLNFPTAAAFTAAVRKLFGAVLGLNVPAQVVSDEPIIVES